MTKYKWLPYIPELGDIVKHYIDEGKPLSIADESGVIHDLELEFARLHNKKMHLLFHLVQWHYTQFILP